MHACVSAYHLNNLHVNSKREIILVKCVSAWNDKSREALVTIISCELGVIIIIIIIFYWGAGGFISN